MRYFATRLHGDGTESLISDWLPLSDVTIQRTLSGVGSLQAKLAPEMSDLLGPDGLPILTPWSSVIYCEQDGAILPGSGHIVSSLKASASTLDITGVGFTGYIDGMPWTDAAVKVYQQDPASLIRLIWSRVQSHPAGNIGLTLSPLDTTARVGSRKVTQSEAPKDTRDVKTTSTKSATVTTTTTKSTKLFKDRNEVTTNVVRESKAKPSGKVTTTRTETVKVTYATKRVVTTTRTYTGSKLTNTKVVNSTLAASSKVQLLTETVEDDEPYTLARHSTTDLGQAFTELCDVGSVDYIEHHTFTDAGGIDHRLELKSPRLGTRRTDILFDTNVNVVGVPDVTRDATDYASAVVILAAGDGDKMITASATAPETSRLRRVRAIEEKGIGRQATADAAAVKYAKSMSSSFPASVTSLEVADTWLAPFGSWGLGDEVRLIGPTGWGGELDMYVRIIEENIDPSASTRTLSVEPADRT